MKEKIKNRLKKNLTKIYLKSPRKVQVAIAKGYFQNRKNKLKDKVSELMGQA